MDKETKKEFAELEQFKKLAAHANLKDEFALTIKKQFKEFLEAKTVKHFGTDSKRDQFVAKFNGRIKHLSKVASDIGKELIARKHKLDKQLKAYARK